MGRDRGLPVAADRGEVRGGELFPAGQRGAGDLGAANGVLLVLQVVAVPVLHEDPDLAGDQVTAAAQPGLIGFPADPDVIVHEARLLGLDIASAVLETEQVAGGRLAGRCGRGPAEAELHPVVLDDAHADPGHVAHGVERDERIVGAGLDAQIAAGVVGVKILVGQRRELGERGRLAGGQAEPVVEQRWPVADRDRQPGHRRPDRLAGVDRRRVRLRVLADQPAGGHVRRSPCPRVQQVPDVGGARPGDGVQRAEREPVLGRCGDAGLVRSVERDRLVAAVGSGRSAVLPGEVAGQAARQHPGARHSRPGEQPPPGRPGPLGRSSPLGRNRVLGRGRVLGRPRPLGFVHQLLTWSDSLDSDSARAFTAVDSWRRCESRTVEYSTYPVSS